MNRLVHATAGFAVGAGMMLSPLVSSAQSDYPNRPVKLIVGFAPGGSTDIVGRIVAQRLGERLGQPVVVENKAGAGGTIGADATAKSPPDGYTLTLGTTSTHAIAAGAYSKLPYNPVTDFIPISLVAITPYLLVVNPQVKANSLGEFVTLAKAQGSKLNYASAGNGTATHLSMEMLKDAGKFDMTHVPYKGNAPADIAILAGEVQAVFGSMPALLQNAKAGKVRPLAVGTVKRSPALPDVPDGRRAGLPRLRGRALAGHHGARRHAQADRRSPAQGDRRRWSRHRSSRRRWTRTAPSRSPARRPRSSARCCAGRWTST